MDILFDISTLGLNLSLTYFFFQKGHNLPSQSGRVCTTVSFHFISWFIYMTDVLVHAAESLGGALQLNTTCGVSLLFEPVV